MKMMKLATKVIIFTMVALPMGWGLLDARQTDQKDHFTHHHHRSDLFSILSEAQNRHVNTYTFEFEETPLNEVLREIANRGNWKILANSSLIPDDYTVTAELQHVNLFEAFNQVLEDTGLDFIYSGKGYVIIVPREEEEPAQEETVTGRVIDSQTGEALPGVNIAMKGTTTGTATNAEGAYTLAVSSLSDTLVFSYIGYESQEIAIEGRTEIDIAMMPQAFVGEELVVVGYGTIQRSDLTGSISSVESEKITSFPSTNVMQALSGRAAGVQVMQNTGAPGASVSVRIRGTNSIQGGNQPLYVVDGFPFSGNPTNLNNSDIESIEVLKDASATAIYGSRGANGVVIITTKQGRAGQTQVDFESSYSIQTIRKKLDLMNAREYAILHNIQAENDNLEPYFTQEEIDNLGEGFDWQDFVFQEAPMITSSLNISGGSETTQFSVGGSIFGQEGIIPGSDYQRYSLRTNVNHEISEKFSFNLSSTLTHLKTERKDSGGGQRGNSMINAAISASPLSRPYNEDGTYTVLADEFPFVAVDLRNPLNHINEQFVGTKANVLLANAALIFEPIPELAIKVSGGIENRDDRTDSYITRNFINFDGSASIGTGQFRSLLSENTISYNSSFDGNHQISAVAGFTYQDFLNTSLGGSGTGFLSDVFETFDLEAAENPGLPNSSYSRSVILSSLARVNYSFSDKYLITASFRSDGASRYSEGNKWGYFPSGAIAWRVSEEGFWRDNNIISNIKLRASWGLTGSQAIGAYATLNQLSSGQTVFGNALHSTFAPGTRLPGELKWETTEQINIGLDTELLNNRIFVTADYYIKNTRDLLNTVRLPSSMGYTNTIQNIGEVQNKGFEFGIDANVLSTTEFRWDVSTNVTINRNKVVSLHEGEDILGGSVSILVMNDNVSILREGRPIGQFWGYLVDGYDEQGQFKYLDLDSDGVITSNDKTYIGDPNPDFIFGINSTTFYKNFELSIFLQGSYGNDIFNVSSIASTLDYGQGLNMPREVFLDHWTPDNTDAKYPIISRSTSTNASDRWVEDGSYIRLKNIRVAYNFPFERLGVRNAQVYISGQNLITLTKYSWWDPELNAGTNGIDHYSYPPAKVFTAGMRIGF